MEPRTLILTVLDKLWWCSPVIHATAGISRMNPNQGQFWGNIQGPTKKQLKPKKKGWRGNELFMCLPSKCDTLSSKLIPQKSN
jgi:hypothetical protein